MTKKVLVIGGTGFLGSRLVDRLSEDNNFDVYYTCYSKKNNSTNSIQLDILNKKKVKNVLKKYDVIINCTGQVTKPIKNCLKINTEGVDNITKCLRNTNKEFIQISTVSIYGSKNKADEKSQVNPCTEYSISKYFAELITQNNLKNNYYLILRLSNLYGDKDQNSGIFSYFYRSIKTDKQLAFDNDGYLSRYYLHINDCVELIFKIINKHPQKGTYNIIGPKQYSIRDLVNILKNRLKIPFKVKYQKRKPLDNIKFLSNIKVKKLIKYKYKYNVENYLETII